MDVDLRFSPKGKVHDIYCVNFMPYINSQAFQIFFIPSLNLGMYWGWQIHYLQIAPLLLLGDWLYIEYFSMFSTGPL